MARPVKIPDDPDVVAYVLKYMALGLPTRLIASAIGVTESTVRGWKRRKDFNQRLCMAKLEVLGKPLDGMADRFPKDFIERHPDTREAYAPPTQRNENRNDEAVHLKVEFVGRKDDPATYVKQINEGIAP
jgi:hypothetical protein